MVAPGLRGGLRAGASGHRCLRRLNYLGRRACPPFVTLSWTVGLRADGSQRAVDAVDIGRITTIDSRVKADRSREQVPRARALKPQ